MTFNLKFVTLAVWAASSVSTRAAPGVFGLSLMAQETLDLNLGDCNKIMGAWTEQFIEPLKNINAFVDQGGVCIGGRTGAQFAFVINTEPVSEGDVVTFNHTVAALNQHQVHGIRASFKHVSALTDVRKVTVTYEGKARPTLEHDFERPLDNFYAQFLDLRDENLIFREHDPSGFWNRLQSFLPRDFISKILPLIKDPIEITSWHWWRGQFDSGESVTSGVGSGNFRSCANSSTPCELEGLTSQTPAPVYQNFRKIWLGQKELFSGHVNAISVFSPKEL